MESVLHVFRQADVEELPRRRILQVLQMLGAEQMETFELLLEAYRASRAEAGDALRMSHFLDWLQDPQKEASEQAAELAVVETLAHRGVSLRSLLAFMRRLPDAMPHFDLDKTRTVDVVWQVIIPETAERGCSYAELVESGEKRLPDKMVSYNWGNLFSHLMAALFADAAGKTSFRSMLAWMRLGARGWDLIEALLEDAGQLDSTRWLCIFAVNQHISICNNTWGGNSALGTPYQPCKCGKEKIHSGAYCEMNKFDAMIALFKLRQPHYEHVVAVDDGLHLLTRIWVIAEIAEVFRNQLPCKVVLLEPRGMELLGRVKAMDVRDAQASRPEDVQMILEKITDKDEFNERTRSALMVVAHLATLEVRVEIRYQMRGLSSPENDRQFLRSVDITRKKLKEAASVQEVQEVFEDFEKENDEFATDEDQIKIMHFCDLLQYADLMQPGLYLRSYREAALPEFSFRPGITDEEVLQSFWMLRSSVRSCAQLPHVYVDGPAFMAALGRSKLQQASVICVTCTPQSEHVVFKMGYQVQMKQSSLQSHLVTVVHRTTEEEASGVTIYRGFDEPAISFTGKFDAKAVANFVIDEALPPFGILHEATRGHYLLKASAGLLVLWLGNCELPREPMPDLSRVMKGVAGQFPDIPCCLLHPAFLEPAVLGRFLLTPGSSEEDGATKPTPEEQPPVAVLFLGELGGRSMWPENRISSEALKKYTLPLELPLRSGEQLCDFIRGARSGTVDGEERPASATPLLQERFMKKPSFADG